MNTKFCFEIRKGEVGFGEIGDWLVEEELEFDL
jgi:hypothetical protein